MANKKKDNKIYYSESFGLAKYYWIGWCKDSLSHFSFAKKLSKIFAQKCSFLGNFSVSENDENYNFPMYYMPFDNEYDVDFVIICNKTEASDQFSRQNNNQKLGGLLFNSEYKIFGDKKFSKVPFSLKNSDYIFLFSADKFADFEGHLNSVSQHKKLKIETCGTPQDVALTQKNSKKILEFVKYMFYETETNIKDFKDKKIRKKLHNKTKISANNYTYLRYQLELERSFTSSLLRREDV